MLLLKLQKKKKKLIKTRVPRWFTMCPSLSMFVLLYSRYNFIIISILSLHIDDINVHIFKALFEYSISSSLDNQDHETLHITIKLFVQLLNSIIKLKDC